MKDAPILSPRVRGVLLLVTAVACFGAVDGFSKMLVGTQSFGQIMLARYAPACVALLMAIGPLRWRDVLSTRRPGLQIIRGLTTVTWTLMTGSLVSLPFALAGWRDIGSDAWFAFLGLSITFGLGQYLLTRAFALAPANVLSPFSYFQILAATVFGWVAFGNVPDGWTWLGIALIILAGLIVFGRRRAG